MTVASVRREIARIEQAIRGVDDAVVEELGGLHGCLHRIVELKDLLPSEPAGRTIDGYSVWRSSRFSRGRN